MTWTAEMKRQFQAKRKDRLKSLGLCVDCGKVPAKTGHVLCESCTEERRERYRRSQAKKRVLDEFKDVANVDLIVAKAERIAQLKRWAAVILLIAFSYSLHAQNLQKRDTSLQPESCYDRISKGREAFYDAARVSNNANTVDDLLNLYRQTSQPGTIRAICTNKRAADIFELKVSLANYIAKVGEAR